VTVCKKNPNATISLVGSSEQGPADGLAMSESIKTYLDVFCNQSFKNSTKGQSKPNIPSEQPGGTLELASS
jgi:hypothetical protein